MREHMCTAASDNKILDRAWRGVEAMELLLETHRQLYGGYEQVREREGVL